MSLERLKKKRYWALRPVGDEKISPGRCAGNKSIFSFGFRDFISRTNPHFKIQTNYPTLINRSTDGWLVSTECFKVIVRFLWYCGTGKNVFFKDKIYIDSQKHLKAMQNKLIVSGPYFFEKWCARAKIFFFGKYFFCGKHVMITPKCWLVMHDIIHIGHVKHT